MTRPKQIWSLQLLHLSRPSGGRRWTTASLIGLVAIWHCGCEKQNEITRYRVLKPQVVWEQNHVDVARESKIDDHLSPPTDRMLAAMIPQASQTWFFKVTGPKDDVAAKKQSFLNFVRSVHFSGGADSEPEWGIPEGWRRLPASAGRSEFAKRFATLEIPTEHEPLKLTVVPMPGGQDALQNVNRWRKQLGLRPILNHQMVKETVQIELDGTTVTVVDLVGWSSSSGMDRVPIVAENPPMGLDFPTPKSAKFKLTYETPEGWAPGRLSVSRGGITVRRQAAFEVFDGSQYVEITVSKAGGDLLSNVNRWRQQIQLAGITRQELNQKIKEIKVGEATGAYIELVGLQESIFGVIVNARGPMWFLKLKGDNKLAQREKDRFAAFVRSIRFK